MKELGRIARWSALGTLSGALVYLAYALPTSSRSYSQDFLSADLIFWLLWVGIPTLPVVFAAVLLARLAARSGRAAALAASVFGIVASAPLFIWYMSRWSPMVGWERGWLLPLASTVAALVLSWIDWSRRRRRTEL